MKFAFSLIALLILASSSAHAAQQEPLYRDLETYEAKWKACYQYKNPAFLNCIDGVTDEAVGWYRAQLAAIRQRVENRPDTAPKLKRFDRISTHYEDFRSRQCEFEANMRSSAYEEMQLQRIRCRFRRAFDTIIHLYDSLGLFGEGKKDFDDRFKTPPPSNPKFRSAIEEQMHEIGEATRPCFEAATTTAARLECSKTGAGNMKNFLESQVQTYVGSLSTGARGDIVSPLLTLTHGYWVQYRRDFCNFVAEYFVEPGVDSALPALRGNRCVFRITVARVREMYQLR